MNKIEFQRRLEEAEILIAKGNYAEAVNKCDLLNLDMIEQPRRLQNIAKAYEKCRRYADAEDLLILAREHAPRSRGILFHLCTVAAKAGEIEEAKNYYQEFCNSARHDSERYILQYRIAKAENKPDEELIPILEEYKRQEPDDRWMFELANLYAKVDEVEKAIDQCEEIELWFSSGKYVTYAKQLYAQLTGTEVPIDEDEDYDDEAFAVSAADIAEVMDAGDAVEADSAANEVPQDEQEMQAEEEPVNEASAESVDTEEPEAPVKNTVEPAVRTGTTGTIIPALVIEDEEEETEEEEPSDEAEPGLDEVEIDITDGKEHIAAFIAAEESRRARAKVSTNPEYWGTISFDENGEGSEEAPRQQDEHVMFTVTAPAEEKDPEETAEAEAMEAPREIGDVSAAVEAANSVEKSAAVIIDANTVEAVSEEELTTLPTEMVADIAAAFEQTEVELPEEGEEEEEEKPVKNRKIAKPDLSDLAISFEEQEQETEEQPDPEVEDYNDFMVEMEQRDGDSKLFGNLPIEKGVDKDTWHFLVYGETNTLTLECARERLTEIARENPSCPENMLKISSEKIGGASIVNSLDHFLGNMVVVEQAASLSDDQLAEFAKVLDRDDRSLLLVFTDSKDDMVEMFRRVPQLAESFTAVFEGKNLSARDLVNTVKEYLHEQDAKMTKEAQNIVQEHAKRILAEKKGFYKNDMRQFAEKALDYADKGGFLGLAAGKCDEEGFLIVAEKHFRKAE